MVTLLRNNKTARKEPCFISMNLVRSVMKKEKNAGWSRFLSFAPFDTRRQLAALRCRSVAVSTLFLGYKRGYRNTWRMPQSRFPSAVYSPIADLLSVSPLHKRFYQTINYFFWPERLLVPQYVAQIRHSMWDSCATVYGTAVPHMVAQVKYRLKRMSYKAETNQKIPSKHVMFRTSVK